MDKYKLAERNCPFFGHGKEIDDFGHCWSKNGEICVQKCNGLLSDDKSPCAFMASFDEMDKNLEMAAATRYPSHVFPVAECVHLREAFKAGAEWQKIQFLSQDLIDELLTMYIGSVDPEDKIKIATYVLIVLTELSIDVNSAETKLNTDMTYKDKRYNTQMVVSFKEDKKKSEEIRLEKKMDMIMRGGRPTLTGYVFTQAQFDKLVPYVKDSEFLNVLKSRVLRTIEGMEIVLRDGTTLGRQSFRVRLKGQEFMLREDADGLYISKVDSSTGKDVITVQPKVANAIVID